MEIVDRLEPGSKLQFLYIRQIINLRESEIQEVMQSGFGNTAVYSKILKTYIQLLQKYSPAELEDELEKTFYAPAEFLPIIRKCSNLPAAAVLYRRDKNFQASLNIYLDLIAETIKSMFGCSSSFPALKARFQKYVNGALYVAQEDLIESNSSSAIWYVVLDRIYNGIKLAREELGERAEAEKVGEYLAGQAKYVLDKTLEYVKPLEILERLTEKYGELEIGLYREALAYVLSACTYQLNVMKTAVRTTRRYAYKELTRYCMEAREGTMAGEVCSKCNERVVDNELACFACGHVFHIDCVNEQNKCHMCIDVSEVMAKKGKDNFHGVESKVIRIGEKHISRVGSSSLITMVNTKKMKQMKRLEVFDRTHCSAISLFMDTSESLN